MNHTHRLSDTGRRWIAGAFLVCSTALLGACGDDATTAPTQNDVRVSVATGGTAARPGTSVGFTLVNNTGRNFEFNLCTDARLERDVNGSWVDATTPRPVCNAIIQLLPPNGRLESAYALPATTVAGRYRITLTMRNGSQPDLVISSEPFTVAP
ncbi:MAG: hypothetical protein MUE41_05740 [Gemmatimonadaceae bacterium]|jgi:hypothetical protein|nr:hypothetical protein [Gemmatimonadaceae bacterium]